MSQASELIFLVGLVVYVATRAVFAHRSKAVETIERRVGTAEVVMLALVMLGSLVVPLLYLMTPVLGFADCRMPSWTAAAGSGVMVAALWLFWQSHADLGRNWSPTLEIREGHSLVTHGVYRRVRHPMYAAILLWSVAQTLLLNNWFAGLAAIVTFLPLYIVRVPREEGMMRDQFGDAYDTYCGQTGRLFPRLTKHD